MVKVIDNSKAYKAMLQDAIKRAKAELKGTLVRNTQDEIDKYHAVATGTMKAGVKAKIEGDLVIVGGGAKYSGYVEFGTGKYSSIGGTPKERWFYESPKGSGKWHVGYPQKPRPYLHDALANHKDEYAEVVEKHLKGQ